jgi:hypothetical protein
MKITIEVGSKKPQEHFSFCDLDLFHQECGGGVLEKKCNETYGWWDLKCERCGVSGTIHIAGGMTTAVIQTAIDGQVRKVSLSSEPDDYYTVQRKA